MNNRRAALLPVAAIGVLLAAAPASASVSASWKTPTDNATFTGTAPIDFVVALSHSTLDSSTVNLSISVPGPQPGPFKVASTSGSQLSWSFNPACPNHAGSCAGGAPAYNGRYTASLSGGTTGSRTVVLQAPPAAPTGVAATATGQHRVKVTWAANKEPDLTGYDVFASDGTVVVESLPVDQLSYEFDLPDSGYGGEHGYVVRAHRLACNNCGGTDDGAQLDSPMSQPGTVTLNEPTPEPQPSDDGGTTGTGTGSGGSGGGTDPGSGSGGGYNGSGGNGSGSGGTSTGGGSSAGGSGTTDNGYNTGNNGGAFSSGSKVMPPSALAQQRAAFGLTFKNFAPKLGAPKLPPLPKFAEQPLPEGTYDPLLSYGDESEPGESATIAEGPSFTTTLVDSFTSVFEGRKLFRSIAIALILLLAAGHLRVWLRHEPHA